MSNKMRKLLLSASAMLLLGGALAGCDDVIATPPADQYDEAQILDVDNVENNTMKQIFDAIVKEGDSNSERVLKNILRAYSESLFGNFWEIKGAVDTNNTTLLQQIADTHEVYKDEDGNGQVQKVLNMYQDFLFRVKKVFYGYVTNTSYQERSQFIESKFYDAQVKANYNLGNEFFEDARVVRGEFRVQESLDSTELEEYFKNLFVTYKEYIELAVLPDIYRDELVCQYLYTVNYRSLGLSYARKIDVIKLAENTSYTDATKKLVESYAKNVIENVSVDAAKYDFTFLDRLYKGLPFDFAGSDYGSQTLVEQIYSDAGWTKFSASDTGYTAFVGDNSQYAGVAIYKESTFGGYISDYLKIYDNTVDDSSILADFTNSGAYTAKTGLQIKRNTLSAIDDTSNGWYNQSGIGSVVPSDISKRLFKITVAQEVDNTSITDGRYGYYRNGGYYMIPETFETGTAHPYIINDSGTYYFIKVNEAVMSSKLNASEANYYDNLRSTPFVAEQIARQIAGILSSSDTYKSDSNKYWVEKMCIIYHDTSIYEYFKKTFPSLFED